MSLFYNLNESKATENVTMKWPSDEYVIPAGTPMSRTGIANDGNAIGILAREARIEFNYPLSIAPYIGKQEPKGNQDFTFTLITGGYVNLEEVEAAFGGEISEEAKAAMSDIVFVKKNIDLGGGGSGGGADVIYKTEVIMPETRDNYYLTARTELTSRPPELLVLGDTYIVTVDGEKYTCVCYEDDNGTKCLGTYRSGQTINDPEYFPFRVEYTLEDEGQAMGTLQDYWHMFTMFYHIATMQAIKIEHVTGVVSGGSGIQTCTVKFVVGSDAAANDLVVYTKHEEGMTSVVNIDGTTPYENQSEYILENVVCGSIIYFAWYYNTDEGDIQIDGGAEQIINSFNAENETMLFKAQSEPDTVSTITVDGFTGLLPEW